jgi:hypothetical protein
MNDNLNVVCPSFTQKRKPEHQACINAVTAVQHLDCILDEELLKDEKLKAGLEFLLTETMKVYGKFADNQPETKSA